MTIDFHFHIKLLCYGCEIIALLMSRALTDSD